jgi:hypothetical protein
MNRQNFLLASAIAGLTSITSINSVFAQTTVTNQSDTTGQQTFSAPSVNIDSSNGGFSGQDVFFKPTGSDGNGAFSFGELEFTIDRNVLNSSLGNSLGLGTFGTDTGGTDISRSEPTTPNQDSEIATTSGDGEDGIAKDSGSCQGELCQEDDAANNPKDITINDLAELLEVDLNESLKQLAAANDAVLKAEGEPRRIVRRQNLDEQRACVNPAIEASKKVGSKLQQSRNFIEKVNQIQPEKGLW